MKLIASMLMKNELGRYLLPCVDHLVQFCDEVVIVDDGSTDGSAQAIAGTAGQIYVYPSGESRFFKHEGQTRQRLLELTLAHEPTHILAIDADEFVTDGMAIRTACAGAGDVWALEMQEIWKTAISDDGDEWLCVRWDGGWAPHKSPILYRVPPHWQAEPTFIIRNVELACGREPMLIRRLAQLGRALPVESQILHFGWTNVAERAARHQRYVVSDGGRFHQSAHLDSIMWPDEKVEMEGEPWPSSLEDYRERISAVFNGSPAPAQRAVVAHDPRGNALREFCDREGLDASEVWAPHVVAFLAGWEAGFDQGAQEMS